MSVIAIQAEAAPYRVPEALEELARSFAAIRATATEGLRELRRVVGVLRADEAAEDHTPQPTLERLDELVGNAEAAGATVAVEVTGTPGPLPAGMELSAYRIVQEALSNAVRTRRAPPRVALGYRPGELLLEIVNGPARSRPDPTPGAGHGVLGMRERAAMLGGELTAGPRPAGLGGDRRPAADRTGGHVSVRVLIADDQAMVREGFSVLLGAQPGIEVVGEAANGQEAVDKAASSDPTWSSWTCACRC